jgi:hypothetical protein
VVVQPDGKAPVAGLPVVDTPSKLSFNGYTCALNKPLTKSDDINNNFFMSYFLLVNMIAIYAFFV